MSKLTGQIVVVTGGSSGIGKACVELFAREGAEVISVALGLYESSSIGNSQYEEFKIYSYTCDVTDESQVRKTFSEIVREFGRIDVLINSAGYAGEEHLVYEMPTEDYKKVMATNIDGTFFCCREVVSVMIDQGSGTIVNISSGAGKEGFAYFSHYCASKFAVIGFTQSLRSEVRQHGIRVVCLVPGPTNTPMQNQAARPALKQMDPRTVALSILNSVLLPSDGCVEELVIRPP